MSTRPILLELSEYAAALDISQLPEATIQRVDWVVMDLVASTFAALGGPNCRKLWAWADASSAGATGSSLLWGTGRQATPQVAAMVNGANGYEAEFDDGNSLGGHWGSSCIPAILALAERDGAPAGEVIAAIVAAYEVGDRVSHAFSRKLLESGVHFPGMMGVFGATVGAARVLRLPALQMAKALGLGSLAPVAPYFPGLVGAESKSMYSGWPNQCGIQFADMAAAGFGGPPDLLEGEQGLAHLWGWEGNAQELSAKILGGLGNSHAITNTYFKPFPCCRWLHPVIQAVGELMQGHGLHADDVAALHISGPAFTGKLYMTQGPFANSTQARYSLPYCAAVAVLDARVGQHSFEQERRSDARLTELSSRVSFAVDDALEQAFPASFSVKVTLTTRQGQAWTSHQFPRWSAAQPATFDELAGKFMAIMGEQCGRDVAGRWLEYFRRGLRADPVMKGFFALMRDSALPSN
jgi:2-methylcitrate dehydratase PrpD